MEFKDLDMFLITHDHLDYWEDVAKIDAQQLISNLSKSGQYDLRDNWKLRDQQWQIRCAQILPYAEPKFATALLIEMSQDSDHELKVYALDSLREIDLTVLDTARIELVMSIAKEVLSVSNSLLEEVVIGDLHGKLQKLVAR